AADTTPERTFILAGTPLLFKFFPVTAKSLHGGFSSTGIEIKERTSSCSGRCLSSFSLDQIYRGEVSRHYYSAREHFALFVILCECRRRAIKEQECLKRNQGAGAYIKACSWPQSHERSGNVVHEPIACLTDRSF